MNSLNVVVHVDIRNPEGARRQDLVLPDASSVMLYDILSALAETTWACNLFGKEAGRTVLLPGYLMVLDTRMVQSWEVDEIPVSSGQSLKFVQVVAGG